MHAQRGGAGRETPQRAARAEPQTIGVKLATDDDGAKGERRRHQMREHRALYPERLPPRDLIAARQRHARDLLRVSKPREHHPGRRGPLAATSRALDRGGRLARRKDAGFVPRRNPGPQLVPRHVVHVPHRERRECAVGRAARHRRHGARSARRGRDVEVEGNPRTHPEASGVTRGLQEPPRRRRARHFVGGGLPRDVQYLSVAHAQERATREDLGVAVVHDALPPPRTPRRGGGGHLPGHKLCPRAQRQNSQAIAVTRRVERRRRVALVRDDRGDDRCASRVRGVVREPAPIRRGRRGGDPVREERRRLLETPREGPAARFYRLTLSLHRDVVLPSLQRGEIVARDLFEYFPGGARVSPGYGVHPRVELFRHAVVSVKPNPSQSPSFATILGHLHGSQ
mmetsp:Transcript_14126/g.57423  ORF Transcript_14126/g.57423 Transcript_14126/m.57423 type:complete len:399 (+) Transcript_14126:4304-5500(+)